MPLILDRQAELKAVDKQPHHKLMHLDRFGKADGLSHQAFDPRAEGEMVPLQLLRPPFANSMPGWIQVPPIRAPAVGVKAANPEGCKQGFEFHEGLILTPAEDIRHYPTRAVIPCLPQPPRLGLIADKRPHFVQLCRLHLVKDDPGC